jgi:integrase
MGSLYRPKYKYKNGQQHVSSIWWLQYYTHGKCIRESSQSVDHAEAKRLLKRREGEATKGRVTVSMMHKVLFSELAALVEADYRINHFRSAVDIELRHRLHILPYFGKMKATQIGEADIDRYVLKRKDEGASNGTVNRELCTIKRAFNLAIQKKIVSDRPHIAMLGEDNVRQGFFEPAQFQSVLNNLPDRLQPVARFAYITGWRKSEILTLQWRQVDFDAKNIRLEAGTTKNREARQFPFIATLESLLIDLRANNDVLKRKGVITPWVFCYPQGWRAGKPLQNFKRAWKTACEKAGVPGRLVHDFRRTAVRNLVRAGIPERVAMRMTGHKTRSVFERYNIVSEGDLRDAATRLETFLSNNPDNIAHLQATSEK